MSTFDLVAIIPIIYGLIRGYTRGILVEAALLLGIVVGITLAFKLLKESTLFLQNFVGLEGRFLPFLAFILILGLLIFGLQFLARLIEEGLDHTPVGWINRSVGAAFGMFKSLFWVSSVVWLMDKIHLLSTNTINNAFLYKTLVRIAPTVFNTVGKAFPFVKDLFGDVAHFFSSF